MRGPVIALILLMSSSVLAFDSAEWHDKRELLTREAERLMVAYTNCAAMVKGLTPAEDVTVPVETFEDGSVKTIIFAQKAQYFLDTGLVWAEGVTVKKFKDDGSLDGQISATNCVVDRVTKSGWAEGPATVVHGKTTFRGEGIYFSSPEAYVKVFRRADIESRDLKFGGLRP